MSGNYPLDFSAEPCYTKSRGIDMAGLDTNNPPPNVGRFRYPRRLRRSANRVWPGPDEAGGQRQHRGGGRKRGKSARERADGETLARLLYQLPEFTEPEPTQVDAFESADEDDE